MEGRIARVCTSFIDVPDKIATSVYFAGCSIRCKDCHNKELWDPLSGDLVSAQHVVEKIKSNQLAEWVAFMGGEPTDQMDFFIHLCKKIKEELAMPIALYTGREFEILPKELLDSLDLIVCGPYKKELHVGGWPASSNQRAFKKVGEIWKN